MVSIQRHRSVRRASCRFLLGGVFCLLLTASTQAETELSANSSSVTSKSLYERISEKAALNYLGIYRGSSLGSLGSSLTPSVNGNLDPDSPQSIENVITAGYKFDKNTMVGVQTHFMFYPILKPASGGSTIDMLDPSIIVNRANIIDSNGFKLTGRLTAHLPMTSSDFLKANNLATAIAPTFVASYDVPNTSLTMGLFGYIRGYIPTASALDTVRTYKVYLAPNFNYQLTKTLSATLWIDLVQATRNGGTGFFSGLTNDYIDIEPGLNWDITKNISINPIINFYPAQPTLKATSLMAFIVARAF